MTVFLTIVHSSAIEQVDLHRDWRLINAFIIIIMHDRGLTNKYWAADLGKKK